MLAKEEGTIHSYVDIKYLPPFNLIHSPFSYSSLEVSLGITGKYFRRGLFLNGYPVQVARSR